MSIGGQLLSSVTGNTSKACLVVHDVRAQGTELENTLEDTVSAFSNISGGFGQAGGQIGPMTQRAAQLHQSVQMLKRTQSALRGEADYAAAVSGGTGADKIFFVQFNPGSLTLYSSNHMHKKKDVSGSNNDQNTVSDTVTPPSVELTTTLLFDKMNIYDAFMFDKLTGVSATTATNAATMLRGETFTVQPYVEGLISALRNPYTRAMTFQWANFSFTGILIGVQAKYTMFSVSGRPVRAELQLRLRQRMNSTDVSKWHAAFHEMLRKNASMDGAAQKVSSLLNLSL
ncbi:MAG: hypothetical protein MR935_03045 [Agathobaculum sp.]|uniref:CIS tube protein n=1 Tax=Agathobaculum sp. TaxID=2048138 RepID=UPI0025BA2AAA|nr:hypothetical protein [Agathobaculum sp.]MCI7125169.1 hypothetical protein [Agathobaculum sp.]MDY3712486.1 hypothetical protein [Agathobaculum sp.]